MDIIGDADELDPARPARGPVWWRGLLRPAGLPYALLDGLIALGAAIAVAALGLVAVIYTAHEHVQAGPGDFFALAVWLTGASLGVPARERTSEAIPGQHSPLTSTEEVRVIAWLLTVIVLVLVFRLVRRGVRLHPEAGPAYGAVRAALTTLSVTVALLVLSLATTRTSIFGFPLGQEEQSGFHVSSSIGLEPVFIFVGPLLLTAAAALAGAAAATQLPRRVAGELTRWRPVLRVAWQQLAVTGVLTGLIMLAYSSVELSRHDSGGQAAAIVIACLLLLPNLAIYGTLGGFGTTSYGAEKLSAGPGMGGPGAVSQSVGIFGAYRPWIVWLLLAAAVAGVLVPALLARRAYPRGRVSSGRVSSGRVSSGPVSSTGFPLTGGWRATVTGLLTATAVVLLGAMSYTISSSGSGPADAFSSRASVGPSLLAAAGLTAVWLTLGYVAACVAVRRGGRPGEVPAPAVGNDEGPIGVP